MSTPSPPTSSAVSRLTPPSTWTSPPWSLCDRYSRAGEELRLRDVGHERLAAEPGLDRHDHDDVEELAVRLERGQRRLRLDAQPGGAARGADLRERRLDLPRSISTWIVTESQPASRNSSMYRPGLLIIRWASNGSSVRCRRALIVFAPEGEIRDEVAVHDVEVDPVGALPLGAPHGVAEVAEVGVEDARGDAGSTGRAIGGVRLSSPPRRPAGTGSSLRSPRSARALSSLEPLAGAARRRGPAAPLPAPPRAGRTPPRSPGRGCAGS